MRRIWKLSMGPGASGGEFDRLDDVKGWIRKGLVLVRRPTGRKAGSRLTQGEEFILARKRDLFYLCFGNEEPGILLLGELTGPADEITVPGGRDEWYARKFRLIKEAVLTKKYRGAGRWWTPNHNSTFVAIPERKRIEFEASILKPYFGLTLEELARR